MSVLHVVQGGIANGDLAWLLKAARKHIDSPTWIVPKGSMPGDEAVIYIAGYGLFATAKITGKPVLRKDWVNRYGAPLTAVSLIQPPLSLGTILRRLPSFNWARYPRSITTPSSSIAKHIRRIITERRRHGMRDITDEALAAAGLEELRFVALLAARPRVPPQARKVLHRARSLAIRLYVLKRAGGVCEGCETQAPFRTPTGKAYLEPHHTTRLADDGPDHPAHVIALCPNCHRRAHLSEDAQRFNSRLKRLVATLERHARPNSAVHRARSRKLLGRERYTSSRAAPRR